jgi:hypothetical protein
VRVELVVVRRVPRADAEPLTSVPADAPSVRLATEPADPVAGVGVFFPAGDAFAPAGDAFAAERSFVPHVSQ